MKPSHGAVISPLPVGTRIPGFLTMLITLVVYEGAFLSEIIRAGNTRVQ